jgi:hypothetical protein
MHMNSKRNWNWKGRINDMQGIEPNDPERLQLEIRWENSHSYPQASDVVQTCLINVINFHSNSFYSNHC